MPTAISDFNLTEWVWNSMGVEVRLSNEIIWPVVTNFTLT